MGFDIVTGGAGFIGKHLVGALHGIGRDVHIIDIKYHNSADIRQIISTKFPREINTIYHLAALADIVPSIENPVDYYHTNVTGTLNMLELAREHGAKFIYAASASCYGDTPSQPTPEINPVNPKYPYALTKYMGEELVAHWAQVYKIPAVSLRLFNVYGLGSRTGGTYGAMFGTFLAQIANEKPITIVGDGEQRRDFIHVSDVVNAFILAANSNSSGIYNVGSGNPTSINTIADLLGAKERIHIPKRPGEPDITCADITRIKRDLKWEPKVRIEQGVKELLDNIHLWKDAPLWDADSIKDATKGWFKCLQ